MPPSEDLRGFSGEYPIETSGERVLASPSSRPTLAPDEAEALALISSSRSSIAPDELMAEMLHYASVGPSVRPLEHAVSEAPPFVHPNPRRRGAARVLFAVLFGGAIALFGYAFQPRVAATLHGWVGSASAR